MRKALFILCVLFAIEARAQNIAPIPLVANSPVTVTLNPGAYVMPAGLTSIPENVHVRWLKGATLASFTNGRTLTIDGTIEAGQWQIFTGTGKIVFGKNIPAEVLPEWFGARPYPFVSGFALQWAEDSIIGGFARNPIQTAPGGVLKLSSAVYVTDRPLDTCHWDGCPGNVGRSQPAGVMNACISIRGAGRGESMLLTEDNSIDMIRMYSWSCSSSVEDLSVIGGGVGIRVRGNQTALRRNWFLAVQGVLVETTATIDTGFTEIVDNICDATQLGGGPNCVKVTRAGGSSRSPNNIEVNGLQCYSAARCFVTDRMYDSRLNGITHTVAGSFPISLTNVENVAVSNIRLDGASVNQDVNEHGLEIITSKAVTVDGAVISNMPGSAVFVDTSVGVSIKAYAFTDNVQTNGAVSPYDVTLLHSDVILQGGSITNNTGHSTRAIYTTGGFDGTYVIDGATVRGSTFTGTQIETATGAGGANSVKINNYYSDSHWVAGSVFKFGAIGGLNVDNVTLHGGSPTTWLESTYLFTYNCIGHNSLDGGNILLNSTAFATFTSGCFNGANAVTASVPASLLSAEMVLGGPTGGFLGTGTINVQGGYFVNGVAVGSGSSAPAGTNGQIQYNNSASLGGFTMGGDCTFAVPNITCPKTGGVAFAPSATTDALNLSNATSGTVAAARGGAGTINGALKGNGSGTVTQAACADLSNGGGGCSLTTASATTASSATPTPTGANMATYTITALAANATFGVPSGSPANGDRLLIRVKDNGTPRTLAWNAIYRGSADLPLPTTTTTSKTQYDLFIYNSTDSKYDFMSFLDNF